MSYNVVLGLLSFPAILLLIGLRIPIGVALGVVSLIGLAEVRGVRVALGALKTTPFEVAANWSLTAIPLFILMGAVAHGSGISQSLFVAARLWLSKLPGGLAVATNFASAGFAAASGSSVATAASMGRLAVPEMLRLGYDKGLATGVVASAGTLGALIPPSVMFVIYGVLAETSITKLLIAGVLPGLLTAAIYAAMIIARCSLNPALAPRETQDVPDLWRARWRALGAIWPLLILILGLIGGLYSGLFTPAEAGAVGAMLSFVIAAAQRRLTLRVAWDSLRECTYTTAQLFFVAYGAIMYTKFLAIAGVPVFVGSLIDDWAVGVIPLMIAASIMYIILGMFLDPLGVLLISLPILLPMFDAVGADPIWVGVIVVKYIEIGLLTPPVGFNVYVVKSVVDDSISLGDIFRGVGWFLVCEAIIMTLLIGFPSISTVLPNTM